MRVLFLDFDGVLNGLEIQPAVLSGVAFGSLEWCAQRMDPHHIDRLNQIVHATQASIVLSTSWRTQHPLAALIDMLSNAGLRAEVIGSTPALKSGEDGRLTSRADEIEAWLETSGGALESYVILDDLSMGHLAGRAVQTDARYGLNDADVERAIALLLANPASQGLATRT